MACVNPMKLLLAADQVFNEDTVLVADGGDQCHFVFSLRVTL